METCISIIIPVYNSEQYLSRCLDSVLNQTYKELEIILINDGSTDDSAEICKKYAAKDKRIKYVEQENHGVAYTRKHAVKLAAGQYVGFVDADDYIDDDMYEKMLLHMKKAQLVTSGFYDQGKKIFDAVPAGLYHTEEEMLYFYTNMLMFENIRGILTNLWNKLFVTQLLKRIVKDTSMEVYNGEDVDILFRYVLLCDSVYVSRICAYHYNTTNSNSISNSEDKNYLKNVNNLYLSLEKEFKKSKYKDILLPKWDQWIWQMVVLLAPEFMGLNIQKESKGNRVIRYLNPYTNLLKWKRVILYGAGKVGKDYCQLYHEMHDYHLVMWTDSDWKRLQKENYNVQSVDQILSAEYDYILIAVQSQETAEEIKQQLQEKGIDHSKLIWKAPIVLHERQGTGINLISRSIHNGLHLCGDKTLEQQTWEQFKDRSHGKKIFVFGTGRAMRYFLRHCSNHMKIDGIVDNDIEQQQYKLGWNCTDAYQTEYENIIIQSPDVLKLYSPQEVTVLITSTAYYQSIISQLEAMGITNYFVLLMMEANAQRYLSVTETDFLEERDNYIQWCCRQKIKPNKIVMSYGEYGGHAKYITKQLLKKRNDLDIVWLVYDPPTEAPDGVRLVPERNWKSYIYEMETARIWLFDITVLDYIIKREGQFYIQAKHWPSITLKKFYLDDKSSRTSSEAVSWIRYNGMMMDYLLSGSDFDEASCRSGFAFNGKAVRVGSPRSDVLFDKKIKKKVYHKFGLDINAHMMLYAPTYRDKEFRESKSMSVSLDILLLLDVLHKKFGGDWYIFVRLHPWIDFHKCGIHEGERIINAGDYPDSEELVAASDMMITDYSSIMFEEAFVKRPVFLYAPDRKEYIDGERGLLIDYDTLPFPIAENNEKLERCIMEFEREKYEKDVTDFLDRYGVCEDGHASERAAAFVSKLMDKPALSGEMQK